VPAGCRRPHKVVHEHRTAASAGGAQRQSEPRAEGASPRSRGLHCRCNLAGGRLPDGVGTTGRRGRSGATTEEASVPDGSRAVLLRCPQCCG